MSTRKIILSPEQEQYLFTHYPIDTNEEVAQHLNISPRTVCRLAAQRNLVKSRMFWVNHNNKVSTALKHYYEKNPRPKGFIVPNSTQYRFQKGHNLRQRIGDERYKKVQETIHERRRETVKKERRRILFGLPQRTNLKLNKQPREKIQLRYYLRKRGYIVDDSARIAYYTPSTQRGIRIERKQQPWYTFRPAL